MMKINYYVQFGFAVFIANLAISILDDAAFGLRSVVKASLAGILAAVLLLWFERRKRRRDHKT